MLNKDEIKSTGKSNSLLKRAQIPETSGNETIGMCLLKSIFFTKKCAIKFGMSLYVQVPIVKTIQGIAYANSEDAVKQDAV